MFRFLKYMFGLGIAVAIAIGMAGAYIIQDISKTLPSHDSLAKSEPPVMTRIHAGDGALLISCQRHAAEFLSHTGECVAGPCQGEFLTPVPFTLSNEGIYLD